MKIRTVVLFLIIAFTPIWILAQTDIFARYGDYRGLYSRVNYKISQDNKGYILVGSDNGLYRYDGVSFEKLGKGTEIENKEVLEAISLNNGDLFVSSYFSNNIYILRNNTNTKQKKTYIKKYYVENSNQHEVIAVDKKNSTIFFTRKEDDGYKLMSFHEGKIKKYSIPFGKVEYFDFAKGIVYLSLIEKGDISTKILFQYNINTKEKKDIYFDPKKYGNFIVQGDNCILTWKDNVIYYFDFINGKLALKSKLKFNHRLASIDITIDKKGNIWIYNLVRGAWYYNISGNKDTLVEPTIFLPNDYINYIFIDKDNNAWFSTKNKGVFFLPAHSYSQYVDKQKTPFMEYISTVKGYGDKIFLGLENSEYALHEYTNGFSKKSFSNDLSEARDLLAVKDNVFLNDYKGPFYQFNLKTKQIKKTDLLFVKSMVPLSNEEILITNFLGAHRYNINSGKHQNISKLKSYTALPFHKDSIFNGSFTDLYKVNINTKKEKLFLKEMYFNEIQPLSKDLFVGASNIKGLLIFDTKKITKVINTSNGLKDNQILSINIENENTIWASSTQGLYRITLNPTIQVKNFSVADGLLSNMVNSTYLKGDSIYIGTNRGLSVFKTSDLLNDQKLLIKKPEINSVTIDDKVFENKDTITTTYDSNTVSIKVSFLDYNSHGRVKFKYRMIGVSNDWYFTSNNTMMFSSLNPGKYTFQVHGINSSNLESEEFASFNLEVKPLFWQTWWFRSLIVVAAFLLGGFLYWNYRDRRTKKFKYDQKISELELQAIKSQFNPHFIYNCLNSIQYLVYKKSFEDADKYLATFSKMVRSTLHYSERTFLPIDDEVEYINIYLEMEKMRFKDNFTFNVIVEPEVDRSRLIPSLLLQPYVENSLKHGISSIDRPGKIEITFYQNSEGIGINIYDNGAGYNPKMKDEKGNHLGLKLSEKRIETYNNLFNTHISMSLSTEKDKFTLIQIFIKNEK